MKHISKFDHCVYEISESVDLNLMKKGKAYRDDITLIWRDAPCGLDIAYEKDDISPRELIGWHWGAYDFDITEEYIKDYYKTKLDIKEQPTPKKLKTIDLPIAYVHLIQNALQVIQKHDLYELLYDSDDSDLLDALKSHVSEVLESFCDPLYKLDIDTKIIIEEDE